MSIKIFFIYNKKCEKKEFIGTDEYCFNFYKEKSVLTKQWISNAFKFKRLNQSSKKLGIKENFSSESKRN